MTNCRMTSMERPLLKSVRRPNLTRRNHDTIVPTNPTAIQKSVYDELGWESTEHTQEANRHVKCLIGGKPSLLEEVGAVVDEIDAGQYLSAVNSHGNLGPTQVNGPEAVPVGTARL